MRTFAHLRTTAIQRSSWTFQKVRRGENKCFPWHMGWGREFVPLPPGYLEPSKWNQDTQVCLCFEWRVVTSYHMGVQIKFRLTGQR